MGQDYRSKKSNKFCDKRLDKSNYTYAQKRLGKMGVNDDIEKDVVFELERDSRYLKRKVRSIGITLGIVIRELEKNGYTFNFPGRKNPKRDSDEVQTDDSPNPFQPSLNVEIVVPPPHDPYDPPAPSDSLPF